MLHHPKLVKKVRPRKYAPTQGQREPYPANPFKQEYNPPAIFVHYDLETTGLLGENPKIVNIACELDTVPLEQWQIVNRKHPRCVVCDSEPEEKTEIRPTVCSDCEEEAEAKPHWFETLVNPGCKIPQVAQDVHKITDLMVKNAPTQKESLLAMFEWLKNLREWYKVGKNFPVILIAHNNFRYDQIVLQKALMDNDLLVPADIYFGDSHFSIQQGFGYSGLCGELKLESLVRKVCLRPGYKQEHLAMLDVEALLDVVHCFANRQELYEALWSDRQKPLPERQVLDALKSESPKKKRKQISEDVEPSGNTFTYTKKKTTYSNYNKKK